MPQKEHASPARKPLRKKARSGRHWTVLGAFTLLAGCWLNGNSEAAYLLISGVTGLGLLLLPPVCRPPGVLVAAAAAVVFFGAVSLLPAAWFGLHEPWRQYLPADWGIALPASVSPQPFLTLGSLLALLTALGWFFLLLGRPADRDSRRRLLAVLAFGITAFAAVALAEHLGWLVSGWPYRARHVAEDDIGPFLNRNHFSSLCAVGAVLCAGLTRDALARRSPLWAVYLPCLLLSFSAIAVNTSRGGLALFFLGMAAWLITSASRGSMLNRLTVVASLGFTGVAALLLYGGGAFARLTAEAAAEAEPLMGFRQMIYLEILPRILSRFGSGAGLGNFAAVSALETALPLPASQLLHPESDWLWLAFDAGVPALIPLMLGLWWVLFRAGPWKLNSQAKHSQRSRYVRGAAGVAVGMMAVNALFDVPLHNLTLACLVLLLASTIISSRQREATMTWRTPLVHRLFGVILLVIAAGHYSGLRGNPWLPGRFHVESLAERADTHFKQTQLGEANHLLIEALAKAPLRWDLHYRHALVLLALGRPADEALLAFGRARALLPGSLKLRLDEGQVWLRYDPQYAIVPWRELLQTQPSPNHYETMLSWSKPHPALRSALLQLAATPALLASRLLHSQTPEEWDAALGKLLEADPELSQIESRQRSSVLQAWSTRGQRSTLIERLEKSPDWHGDAWRLLAREYAQQAEFEKAWHLLKKHAYATTGHESSSDLPLNQLEREFLQHPADLKRGIDLFFAQKRRGMLKEAMRTLEKILALPSAPAWLAQEQADLLASQNDFRRAYELMESRLTKSP